MLTLPPALGALQAYPQFMLYRLIPKGDKTLKLPCNIAGETVDAHDETHWVTADVACAEAARRGSDWGVAFTVSEDDPFFFIDIDNCLIDGQWAEIAQDLCRRFAGAAVEVSQSGRGLHIIGTGSPTVHTDDRRKKAGTSFDLYTEERFIALTGKGATGDAALATHQTALDTLVDQYLKLDVTELAASAEWTTAPHPDSCPIPDDARLIDKALKTESAASMFGARASFKDLWTANVESLAAAYPPDQGNDGTYDASAADAGLAQHLAFWTGGDCARIERLMRLSALARPKWDKRPDYLRKRTIPRAAGRQTTWYTVGKPVEVVAPVAAPTIRSGYQFMPVTQQIEYFNGCVYVADAHRILTPNGSMLKSEQFNAMWGGYTFSLDDTGEKTTKKAWEAFTENQGVTFPKVDSHVFRPADGPGAIITEEGRRLVNTYVPIHIDMTPGDVTPFLAHMAKLLPNERDREIAICHAAAIVQYPGRKFQWAPLYQGCEGNGKTLITRCVAYAVGQRYTHLPPASEIGEKFNAWLFDKIFIGVEDIYVPDQKLEVLEILKPMITGDKLARRGMQQDQVMVGNCANFIFNSNHKQAIRKTLNDRRFSVFYTAQQHADDLTRDGMSGDYFPKLYDWLRNGGYAHVAAFLKSYPIADEFNPTTRCQRAPITSTTAEAVEASLGGIEQEIMEAIEEGRTGFAGGWVSSMHLDKLIERLRAGSRIPPRKRRDLMKGLGYDWHPALRDGRVNNFIMIDQGKPRLYIRDGHIHGNLVSPGEVSKHYEAAQGDPMAIAALKEVGTP